jgi:putative membrane protein insertion efficiency factor
MTILLFIARLPFRLYKLTVSPLIGPCCRFQPSCSCYAQQAVETHGLMRGSCLAAWRILRCNPLCRHGYDPVPENWRSVFALRGTIRYNHAHSDNPPSQD